MIENKESFQARIKPHFSPSIQLDIKLAYVMAKFGHRAQKRKELDESGNPTRYFEHVRRVAIIVMDELKLMDKDLIMAALLHDCFEDSDDITPELVEHAFGVKVVNLVKILSKTPKEGYFDRLKNCGNHEILALKACDRLDNLRSLMVPGTSIEFQKRQVKETEEIYFPIFDYMIKICPTERLSNLMAIRDEIRRLVERYKVLIEMQEKSQQSDSGGCRELSIK